MIKTRKYYFIDSKLNFEIVKVDVFEFVNYVGSIADPMRGFIYNRELITKSIANKLLRRTMIEAKGVRADLLRMNRNMLVEQIEQTQEALNNLPSK